MIQFDEAIAPDQVIPATQRPDRVLILYPRGQNQTILFYLCDANPPVLKVVDKSQENSFGHWIQSSNGDLINPCDNKPASPACKIVGYK